VNGFQGIMRQHYLNKNGKGGNDMKSNDTIVVEIKKGICVGVYSKKGIKYEVKVLDWDDEQNGTDEDIEFMKSYAEQLVEDKYKKIWLA
jgi:hypothetical protein